MNKEEKMNELGLAGEKIVINMLSSLGLKIESSINKYDSEKDMLVDGKKVEVKAEPKKVEAKAVKVEAKKADVKTEKK